MKKKLIVHIGTHKTGTTSIQESLMDNVAILRANDYCFVPLNKFRFILRDLAKKEPAFELFKMFKNSSYSSLLISAERLSGEMANYNANFTELENLKKISIKFDFELKVICYLRKQDSFLESTYMQQVKWGYKDTFTNYLEKHKDKQSWFDFVSKLSSIFTSDELYLKPFSRKFFTNNDIIDDFWNKLSLNNDYQLSYPLVRNESYGFSAMEITRNLNPYLSIFKRKNLRHQFESVKHEDKLKTLFNENEHKSIQEHYNKENFALCEMLAWPKDAITITDKQEYFDESCYLKVKETKVFWENLSKLKIHTSSYKFILNRVFIIFKRRAFYCNLFILRLILLAVKKKRKAK